MSGSVNKVIILGRLGADPDIRTTQDGRTIANLSVATSEKWRDKQSGEQRERTEWHRVVIFSEGLAKVAQQFLRKGSSVYLEGQLQTRKWQDQNGQDRYVTEIVLQGFNANLTMLDGPKDDNRSQGASQGDYGGNQSADYGGQGNGGFGGGAMDDEVPFLAEFR